MRGLRPERLKPHATKDFSALLELVRARIPFTFVRFSDGESEVIHGSRLVIQPGKTVFQGRVFENCFPEWDSKNFDPALHTEIRADVISSALHLEDFYLKGILTSSNRRKAERFMMMRWNQGFVSNLTFTDLLINANYPRFSQELLPSILSSASQIFVICNFRGNLQDPRMRKVPVPDNFFGAYSEVRDSLMATLLAIPENSFVLSSASSMSNVIGHRLRKIRPDVTFLDVGSAMNPYMGFGTAGRNYLFANEARGFKRAVYRALYPDLRIRW